MSFAAVRAPPPGISTRRVPVSLSRDLGVDLAQSLDALEPELCTRARRTLETWLRTQKQALLTLPWVA
jgi:hypothetical protein